MWASQLLTLNTSTSSASITFDFTNPTDRSGPTNYAGVSVVEIVMFNCPVRGIGTNNVKVSANSYIVDNIAVSESCEYLVRGCSESLLSQLLQPVTLSFNKVYSRLYVAEVTFRSSFAHQCSPVGPLTASVRSTTEQTSTIPSNQGSTSNKKAHPPVLASETSTLVFFSATTQDEQTTMYSSLLIIPLTTENTPNVVEYRNISVSTDYMPTKSIQGPSNSNIELEMLN